MSETYPIDFTEVRRQNLPEGYYTGQIFRATLGKSGIKGTPQVSFLLRVLDEGPFNGAVQKDIQYLTPKALWRLLQMMTSGGMTIPEGSFELDPDSFIDVVVGFSVEDEEYNGVSRARVKTYCTPEQAQKMAVENVVPDFDADSNEDTNEPAFKFVGDDD